MSANKVSVKDFLSELQLVDEKLYEIVFALRTLILKRFKDVEEKIMYGGIVFFIDKNMISGVFAYENHVSLEFSRGFEMTDPDGLLEGKGKYRRHLKFNKKSDIEAKEALFYINQSV